MSKDKYDGEDAAQDLQKRIAAAVDSLAEFSDAVVIIATLREGDSTHTVNSTKGNQMAVDGMLEYLANKRKFFDTRGWSNQEEGL